MSESRTVHAAYHPVRYWRQEQPDGPQNFGDFLAELFLADLFGAPWWPADAYYLVGSVIREQRIRRTLAERRADPTTGCVAFWGCGARGPDGLPEDIRSRAAFLGVRGPLTRDALGLPADTVLGDPGLLLPLLVPRPRTRHGRTLCITHFHEPRPVSDLLDQTGVDDVIPAAIPGSLPALRSLVERIAAAEFVLSGSLHGAITACAYGVPFAFFDSGRVDVPFKWEDFAASVGIPSLFAQTLAEGRRLYADAIAPALSPLPLSPLLHVAPFQVLPAMILRAVEHDRGVRPEIGLREDLANGTASARQLLRDAQRLWLQRERVRFEKAVAHQPPHGPVP